MIPPPLGRNFEYVSGEDPFLGFNMAKQAVAGIQSQGVIANLKHYVNNNQETDRSGQTASIRCCIRCCIRCGMPDLRFR